MVELLVEVDDLEKYAISRLRGFDKAVPKLVKKAINKTAKEIKKLDERKAKQVYTAKSEINNLEFTRATTGNLQAVLHDKGNNIGIAKYLHNRGSRIGVSAIINRLHGRKRITKYGNKAFTAEMESGHNGVFVRVPGTIMQYSKTRYRRKGTLGKTNYTNKHIEMIEEIKSISSPVIHGNDNVWAALEPKARDLLYENLDKEIEIFLGGYRYSK